MVLPWGLLIIGVALLLLGALRWQYAQSLARESVQVMGEVISHDRALNVEGRGRIHLPKGGELSEDEALAMAGLPPGGALQCRVDPVRAHRALPGQAWRLA